MPKFVLSKFVEAELAEIWDFIAHDNLDAADSFQESAVRTFQELAETPRMGRTRAMPDSRLDDLRSFRVKEFENFLIFYRLIDDGIEVLHVVHAARDLERF